MLYIQIKNGKAVSAQSEYPQEVNGAYNRAFENRNDWKSLERAEEIATQLTEATGRRYVGTDAGPHVSPRFDVVAAPAVGDKISYAFNGDYYPDGEIVKISDSLRIVYSSTGSKYYRRRQSGRWVKQGGTWSLVSGHVSKLNPHF